MRNKELFRLCQPVCLVGTSGTVLYFSPAVERWVPLIALGIFFISALLGGFSAARKAGCKGLLHGLGVGSLFLLLTLIISLFLPGQLLGLSVAKKVVSSLLAGLLGGIWGVGNQ
ncbi:MAG: TIGR04086 family membrane protein [Actinobacteria bacterium]|nr:MAG: TIGR04086 family membrane protein [Actinomycetota bacterium]